MIGKFLCESRIVGDHDTGQFQLNFEVFDKGPIAAPSSDALCRCGKLGLNSVSIQHPLNS